MSDSLICKLTPSYIRASFQAEAKETSKIQLVRSFNWFDFFYTIFSPKISVIEFRRPLPDQHAWTLAMMGQAAVFDAFKFLAHYEASDSFAINDALAQSVSLGSFSEGMMTKPHHLEAFEAHRLVFQDLKKNMKDVKNYS